MAKKKHSKHVTELEIRDLPLLKQNDSSARQRICKRTKKKAQI